MHKFKSTISGMLIALAACSAPWEPNRGAPPLSGNWQPTTPCGIDIGCGLELRVSGTSVAGFFAEFSAVGGHTSKTPLHGTYNPPAIHLEWGQAPYTTTFDGTVQGDTLLVGIQTPPYKPDAGPESYRKLH